jgi:hypothetical protein
VSVRVVFECGGCDAKADGTDRLRREFRSFSGRSHGVGTAGPANSVEDVTPAGWIAYDPYTYCTYCPKCWAEIDPDAARMHDEQRAESLALGLPRTAKHAERLEAIERLKRWKETAGHLGSYVANNEPERFQAELSAARGLLRELGEGANTKSDYMIYVTLATYEKLAPYRTTTEDTDAS